MVKHDSAVFPIASRSYGEGGDSRPDPIAVIGIGCRLPGGVTGPQALWSLLRHGGDAIQEIPEDRWSRRSFYDPRPGLPGKSITRWGGFVEGIGMFDANFFGISPREASRMDPQQRLVLEAAWETLEDGGQAIDPRTGSDAGVFVGISNHDYSLIQNTYCDPADIDAYGNTGAALSMVANRVSYCLNLQGPSMVIDTACSSSLVAVHLACQSLRHAECGLALAGGVNVLISPETYIGFSKMSMVSPEGKSKAFDARADGMTRSEGVVLVALKPLSRAQADRDPIYAVIRGSAVNQDGRSPGITFPSQSAQEALVTEACRQAGVAPGNIQFVETHGPGTPAGDPVEARALGHVLSIGRAESCKCLLGSVKTNLGHLEPVAGAAGLVKTALSLKHGMIPPNLHFKEPNPEIPFDELQLRVPVELEPWPAHEGLALAGVNSFGFGGTNAHVVLQEAPAEDVPAGGESDVYRPYVLPISARSAEALKALAQGYCDALNNDETLSVSRLNDICHTASLRRVHHDHRLAVVGGSHAALVERLGEFVGDQRHPTTSSGRVAMGDRPKLVFVCSGQGPQWWAMGRQLLEIEPTFRNLIHHCDELVRELGDWSLWEELTATESESRMDQTSISQPAIFALQVALAVLWKSWGIQPDAIVGHSVGEVAAAHIAGVLTLEDAVRVIFHRGRCMALTSSDGRMLAVELRSAQAQAEIGPYGGRICIAAVNSPTMVTLSGERESLEAIAKSLDEKNVFCRPLRVNYAFHSSQMDPIRDELLASLEGIETRPASIPIVSTVRGDFIEGRELGAGYWWDNVRQQVRFADGVDKLIEEGSEIFLELSPHPVLGGAVRECLSQGQKDGAVLVSLRRKEDEQTTMLGSLGALYTLGCPVDWSALHPHGRCVRLPRYPWQRQPYWHESKVSKEYRLGTQPHPLLGLRLNAAHPTWETKVDGRLFPYLKDHVIQGHVLLPATGFLELAFAAADQALGAGPCVIEDFELPKACFLPPEKLTTLHTVFTPQEGAIAVLSRSEDDESWTAHARGRVRLQEERANETEVDLTTIRNRCIEELAGESCYARFQEMGFEYGPTFQGIARLWAGRGEALAEIHTPESLTEELAEYCFHPAILDACLQVTFGVIPAKGNMTRQVYLPVGFEQVRLYGQPGPRCWVHSRLSETGSRELVADFRVYDEEGILKLETRGFRARAVDGGQTEEGEQFDDLLYQYQWHLKSRSGPRQPTRPTYRFASPTALARKARQRAGEDQNSTGLEERFKLFGAELERLCTAYVLRGLEQLGWQLREGDRFETDALADRLTIAEQHRRLFRRYLHMLERNGILRAGAGTWEVVRAPAIEDPQTIWQQQLARSPAAYAELTMIGRCGQQLADILRGDVNPLQLLFPEGSLAMAEHLYQDAPMLRFANLAAQHALRDLLETYPRGRSLRVLEIGAGTGGLTSYMLPVMPADRTKYVFTDLSKHFLLKAEQKFRDYPFVEHRILDIENDPVEQKIEEHSFDLILISEVLHATVDLRRSLNNVRKLLASEGMLFLVEAVREVPWLDLVFGLTEGWWRFEDTELRGEYPLLSLDRWRALLLEVGFDEAEEISGQREEAVDNAVIAARGPRLLESDSGPTAEEVDGDLAGEWLILADRGGVAQRLTERIEAAGGQCQLVFCDQEMEPRDGRLACISPDNLEEIEALLRQSGQSGRPVPRDIVHLWSLDTVESERSTAESLESDLSRACLSVVHLAKTLSRWEDSALGRLWLVTRGAQSVGETIEPVSIGQAPLVGLGRVVINEFPQLGTRLVDLGPEASEAELASLFQELCHPDEEDEIALRGQGRYVHRLSRSSMDTVGPGSEAAEDGAPTAHRLEISRLGVLDKLTLRAFNRCAPERGEMEICVAASGLNFADVMKGLGIYPGLPDGPVPLGFECAGIVCATGPGVENFSVGDRVMAVAPYSFGTYVTTSAQLACTVPTHISLEEAATLPIAFLTAYYALSHLGRLGQSERVLIHSATGGVGLAAIQIAKKAGAEIFATAGTPEKREFLRSLGIEHVMDSRSLAFADQVLEATDGQGVDVVLNSLPGEAIAKSLALLRPYGRFLEIGKRDIYGNSRVGLRPFRKNLSFMAIDLDRGMRERPDLFSSLFRQIAWRLADGSLGPIPYRVFSASNIVSAFRYMSQARHIGKIVINMQDPNATEVPARRSGIILRSDGTYLISGGLGGLGLTIARWLIEQGARHLVLMGRHGVHSDEDKATIASMRQAGAEVAVVKADVTDATQVAEMLAGIKQEMPPLRGVIHAAMVLEDCLLFNLDRQRMLRVTGPKISGAWNLHTHTLDCSLDFFLMFSSMSSMFGIPGQGNYGAGNAFLDGLAHYRRARGLPALAVNWGAIGQVGYVAGRQEVADQFARNGVYSITPDEMLTVMSRLLAQEAVQVGVLRIDWAQWRGFAQVGSGSPRVRGLIGDASPQGADGSGAEALATRSAVLSAAPENRTAVMTDLLCRQVAGVLGASADQLDTSRPLTELGLDSLMGVELRNWIESELRLNLPTVELLRGPSVERLAEMLVAQLAPSDEAGAASSPSVPGRSESMEPTATMLDSGEAETPAKPPGIPIVSRDKPLPVSLAQQRLWMLEQLVPGATATMNNPGGFRLIGPLDVDALRRSINELVRRHETLRTTFDVVDGQPVQVIGQAADLEIPVIDLRNLPELERDLQVRRSATEQARRPFDLRDGALLRVNLYRVADEEHILAAVLHHIVADGWSVRIFARDCVALYSSYSTGKAVRLKDLAIQYADFAAWQRAWASGQECQELLAYWTEKLAGDLPALCLPIASNRPAVETFRGKTESFVLDEALSDRVKNLARREGCTLYMVLFAAFSTLLHRYAGGDQIAIGSPIANRTRAETEGLIGFLANTIVHRVNLSEDPTFGAFLHQIRRQVLDANAHQELPFEILLEALRPTVGRAQPGLFNVMFNLMNIPMPDYQLPELRVVPMDFDNDFAPFDLMLMMQERGRTIEGFFNYKTDLFDGSAIRRLVGHFVTLLESATSAPDQPISKLSLVSAQEKRQLLAHSLPVGGAKTTGRRVHELLEAQAARTPSAFACAFDETELTYRELNTRANQLARCLREYGVGPKQSVAVCLTGSELMVVGMLGVLKAGGSFLAIEADWSVERMAFVLKDAAPSIVITHEDLAQRFADCAVGVLCLDKQLAILAKQRMDNLEGRTAPEQIVWITYAADATGSLVQNLISHQSLTEHCVGLAAEIGFTPEDRVLHHPAPLRGSKLPGLFSCWIRGAAAVLWDESAWFTSEQLRQCIELEEPTILSLQTDDPRVSAVACLSAWPAIPPYIRMIITDGLVRLPDDFETLRKSDGKRIWANTRGLADLGLATAIYVPDADDRGRLGAEALPLGRPVGDMKLYVLDRGLALSPIGIPGELFVGGSGLSLDSVGDSARSAERFVPDPFGDEAKDRLYRTGRPARYRPDGQIDLL